MKPLVRDILIFSALYDLLWFIVWVLKTFEIQKIFESPYIIILNIKSLAFLLLYRTVGTIILS